MYTYYTEGYAKRDLGRRTGAEATGIRKVWQEGGSSGIRQRLVMSGDGAEALDTGNAWVNRGPRGETMWYRYSGTEMGYSQVGG